MGSIDTVAPIDVKNNKRFILNCFRSAQNIIISFIDSCLSKPLAIPSEYITLNQVKKIDSIQKSEISLYRLDSLREGVYTSYQSLKDQLPDYTDFDFKMKHDRLVKVEKKSSNADNMDYSFNHVYAVVINNKIFIHENYNYYLLEKRDENFFFRTKVKTGIRHPGYFPIGYALSRGTLIGIDTLMVICNKISKDSEIEFEMKIDHLDGSFIPYKMIKK